MNKFAAAFLILFFIVLISVGALAYRADVVLHGQASKQCITPEFPENPTCPTGQEMDLITDTLGCMKFQCVPR